MSKAKVMEWVQKYTMILALILVVAFFAVQTGGKILYPQNITNLIAQNGYVFILSVGMLFCILTGGNIDLAVGSVVCFVGAVGATLMVGGMNVVLAVIVMLLIGTVIGAWQGFWIAYVRIPAFIVTLAGMLVFRGLSNVVLGGMTLSINKFETFIMVFGGGASCYFPDLIGGGPTVLVNGSEVVLNMFSIVVGIVLIVGYLGFAACSYISNSKKGYANAPIAAVAGKAIIVVGVIGYFFWKFAQYKGVPTVLAWIGAIVVIYTFISSKTTLGRHFYAVGGNEKATKLSGINTDRIYFIGYTNMGLLCALAGMLTIARMVSAQPTYGDGYELDAIGACYIGGASAYGGVGTVPGVIIGALLMGVINLGMSIMGVDANYQKVVKGLVLLAAVVFDVVSKRKKA
ncbi:sugar ABC transporter permease [Bengtsoniella intestinalis]|uniref:multiple monosaccharide ABC transporter permease n=1 Tax=Bengtsoniella intestinalis TaxID=3073143 RepID=UPI00391F41F1